MILNSLKRRIFLFAVFCLTAAQAACAVITANGAVDVQSGKSPWHFDAGIGMRNLTPLIFIGGVSYQDLTFRVQGMGVHNGPRDFWCGIRGSFLWTVFANLPFNLDLGIGGGYEYAEAPNKLHQTLNNVNDKNYLFPYNYKENLDVSLELWPHIYGFYTQISIPIYHIKNHDAPHILWGTGYSYRF